MIEHLRGYFGIFFLILGEVKKWLEGEKEAPTIFG